MQEEIYYKITKKDFNETIIPILRNEVKSEIKALLNQFIIDAKTVAKYKKVNIDTVYAYAEQIGERKGPKAKYEFRLGNVLLDVDFKELRRKLKS